MNNIRLINVMRILKLAFFILLATHTLISQRVKSNISISYDRLSGEEKEKLRDLKELIQKYIDETNWFANDDQTLIQIKLSIFIEAVSVDEGKNLYTGQFIINSESQENFYDKTFKFYYNGNVSFNKSSSEYNPLLNVLDFYLYMVLAGEADTFDEYAGDNFYNKAQSEVFLGKNNNFSSEWKFRDNLLKDAVHPQAKPLRIAKLDFYTLLSYKDEKKYDKARLLAKKIIKDMSEIKKIIPGNLAVKRFFDGNTLQIIDVLDSERDQEEINLLIILDPSRREEIKKYKNIP